MFRICLTSSTMLYEYVCFAYVFFRKEGTCCWFQRGLCTSTKDSPASAGQSLPSSLPRWTSPEASLCGSPFTILRTIVRILNCRSQHCQVCRVWLWKHMPQHVSWIGLLAKRTQSGFEHAERQMSELMSVYKIAKAQKQTHTKLLYDLHFTQCK